MGREFGPPLLAVERELHVGVDDAVGPEALPEFFEAGGEGGPQVGVHCQAVDAARKTERRVGRPALPIAGEHEVGSPDLAGELFDDELTGVGLDIGCQLGDRLRQERVAEPAASERDVGRPGKRGCRARSPREMARLASALA